MSEHEHQAALFHWAEMEAKKIPELDMLFAVPNGGHRHAAVAAKLKLEGVKSGYPDIGLDVARHGFHGLRIELKKPKCGKSAAGRLSKPQADWLQKLSDQGYMAVCCVGWEAAKETIEGYLIGGKI